MRNIKYVDRDGKEIPDGCALQFDHFRTSLYIHNAGLERMQKARETVQTQFKVLYMEGEKMVVQHMFICPDVVKNKVRKMINRPVTHVETVGVCLNKIPLSLQQPTS